MATLKPYALTNLADVKESLAIASSDTSYDNLIIRKINQATAAIEKYCGRRFKATTYEDEIYNGTNGDQLVLNQYPLIISDTYPFSLSGRQTSQNEDDFDTVDSELYFTDVNSGVINLNFRARGHWGPWSVTYRAGYETIPDDLAEACASLAAFYVLNADSANVGVSSKQEGQRKVSYATATQTFQGVLEFLGINDIINSYASTATFADK